MRPISKILPPAAKAAWKRTFLQFLQELTLKDPRRLILKSPPHSCRIETLLELFPDVQFVHIVRDPFVVFPSTVSSGNPCIAIMHCRSRHSPGPQGSSLRDFVRLHQKIEEGTKLLDRNRFYELRYEDLVRDPVTSMHRLDAHLNLAVLTEFCLRSGSISPRSPTTGRTVITFRRSRGPRSHCAGGRSSKDRYASQVEVAEHAGRRAWLSSHLIPRDHADEQS